MKKKCGMNLKKVPSTTQKRTREEQGTCKEDEEEQEHAENEKRSGNMRRGRKRSREHAEEDEKRRTLFKGWENAIKRNKADMTTSRENAEAWKSTLSEWKSANSELRDQFSAKSQAYDAAIDEIRQKNELVTKMEESSEQRLARGCALKLLSLKQRRNIKQPVPQASSS